MYLLFFTIGFLVGVFVVAKFTVDTLKTHDLSYIDGHVVWVKRKEKEAPAPITAEVYARPECLFSYCPYHINGNEISKTLCFNSCAHKREQKIIKT